FLRAKEDAPGLNGVHLLSWCVRSGALLRHSLPNCKVGIQQYPILRKRITQCPIAHTTKVILFYQVELGLCTSGILKPYFMFSALFIDISEKRGLCGCIKLNGDLMFRCASDGFLLTECLCLLTLDMGKQP